MGGDRGLAPGCSGSLWKSQWKQAAQSEAQGHRHVQELLFVSSGPSLSCSGSALTDRWGWGCFALRAMGAVPVCPALLGACPGELHMLGGACPGGPCALGGG